MKTIAYYKPMKYLLAIIILIFTSNLIIHAQVTDSARNRLTQTDSITNAATAGEEPVDGFDPGLLIFLLVFLGIIVAAIGFGVFLTAIILFGIFAMVSLGIISASIFAGIYTRSVTKGFKVFFILCAIALGGLFGCTALYGLNVFTHWFNADKAILWGGTFGLVAGLAGGLVTLYFLKQLTAWLKTKIVTQTIAK
jgi:hypothetical protein